MTKRLLQSFFGPRVPDGEIRRPGLRRWRYAIPTVLFLIAASILLASFTQRYWNMTLHAPQYPKGLHVHAYLDRLGGDVQEVDNLNHYIGMRPLEEAAQLERSLSLMMTIVMASLLLAAVFVHSRWAALLALPALFFPAGFLLDLHLWMDHFGQNLDPTAALSSSIKPFTPPVLGEGVVGNFRTTARADVGLIMATVASGFVLVGLYFHRRAYKPLVDARKRTTETTARGQQSDAGSRHSARAHSSTLSSLSVLSVCSVVTLLAAAQSVSAFDLHAAIAQAEENAVIIVPPGTYRGPLLIDRPMTLDAANGLVVIDGGGEGDVVRITAPGVTFRGFTIRNSGAVLERENAAIIVLASNVVVEDNIIEDALYGIRLTSARESVVRNNTITGKDLHIARRGDGIRLWDSHDSIVEGNVVTGTRDVVMWYSDRVQLRNNRISQSRYGLHFMYSHDNVLEENVLEENSVGAFLMYSRNLIVRRNVFARNRGPSGYGLGVKDMQGMVVENNVFVGNCVGVYLDNPPVYLPERDRFTRNVFAYNDLGVAFQPSVRRTAFFENSFIENHQQVAVWGGGELRDNLFTTEITESTREGSNDRAIESQHPLSVSSVGSVVNRKRGNYWSDYRGFDSSRDGVGDLPYRAESLWDNLMDREPGLRLFMFSPAQQAVEMAAKAFPVVKPRALFSDDAPLMTAVRADVPLREQPRSAAMWVIAAGLLAIAGIALSGAKPQAASRRHFQQRGERV